MFNNVLKRKQTFFHYKNKFFQSSKNRSFPKRLTHAFGKKMLFFHYLFSLKISLEPRFNNVLDRKQTFFDYIKKEFSKSQKTHFSRGVNPYCWSKMLIFSSFVFA